MSKGAGGRANSRGQGSFDQERFLFEREPNFDSKDESMDAGPNFDAQKTRKSGEGTFNLRSSGMRLSGASMKSTGSNLRRSSIAWMTDNLWQQNQMELERVKTQVKQTEWKQQIEKE
jgi:hypothetical protein